jgi:acetolactate synthase-1/2/3 large subunit
MSSDKLHVVDLLVGHLRQAGARSLFGVPGGAITPLYEAVAGESGVTPILTKHEAGAAFMADGYARVGRTLGACCTTSGPGATNALTAIACSRADSVPVLLLSGQVAPPRLWQGRHPGQLAPRRGRGASLRVRHQTVRQAPLSWPCIMNGCLLP